MEKAILDYFYIHSDIKGKHDFESLRVNKDIFSKQVHEETLYEYVEKFAQKALTKRIQSFLEFLKGKIILSWYEVRYIPVIFLLYSNCILK